MNYFTGTSNRDGNTGTTHNFFECALAFYKGNTGQIASFEIQQIERVINSSPLGNVRTSFACVGGTNSGAVILAAAIWKRGLAAGLCAFGKRLRVAVCFVVCGPAFSFLDRLPYNSTNISQNAPKENGVIHYGIIQFDL